MAGVRDVKANYYFLLTDGCMTDKIMNFGMYLEAVATEKH